MQVVFWQVFDALRLYYSGCINSMPIVQVQTNKKKLPKNSMCPYPKCHVTFHVDV